jgi:hypothetical protein
MIRIVSLLAAPALMAHEREAFIHDHVTCSDHRPVGVELDLPLSGTR